MTIRGLDPITKLAIVFTFVWVGEIAGTVLFMLMRGLGS